MMPDQSSTGRTTRLSNLTLICRFAERFDAAWQAAIEGQGQPPLIEEFLQGVTEEQRLALLEELIAVELECRERRLEGELVDEYLARFPEASVLISTLAARHAPTSARPPFLARDYNAETIAAGERPTEPRVDAVKTGQRVFGEYELLSEIARGGMGVVYKARQRLLNRLVAVKMILSGELASEEAVRRFRTEAEAAGRLRHPGIVAVYEVGQHDGQHFFSMEYVEGQSLAVMARANPYTAKSAVECLQDVAEAIQYAHENGILHRDLKPSNVLIDTDGRPRVTDFGLAKQMSEGASGQTRTHDVMGTPSYMPPEQAEGRLRDLGPSSDVYSLGAILYELLTGRPPFRGETALDTLLEVLDREPVSPRLLNPKTPQDLETICLKCLEKDPARRYPSAGDLADELGRFLAHEPILARPLNRVSRAVRWCRRKPLAAAVIALGIMLIASFGVVLPTIYSGIQANRQKKLAIEAGQRAIDEKKAADIAKNEAIKLKDAADVAKNKAVEQQTLSDIAKNQALEQKEAADIAKNDAAEQKEAAEKARKNAEYQEYIGITGLAAAKIDENAHDRAKEMLKKYEGRPDLINWEWGRLMRLCNQSIKDFPAADKLETVAFDSTGKHIVAGGWSGRAYLWKNGAEKPLVINAGGARVNAVAFSPTQDVVATGSDDDQGYIRLWNASTGEPVVIHPREKGFVGHTAPVLSLSFSKDGKQLLSSSVDGTARLWNVDKATLLSTLKGHNDPVSQAVFSPREDRIVTVSDDGTAIVWTWGPRVSDMIAKDIEEQTKRTSSDLRAKMFVKVFDVTLGSQDSVVQFGTPILYDMYMAGMINDFCRSLPFGQYEFYLKEGATPAVLVLKVRVVNNRLLSPLPLTDRGHDEPWRRGLRFRGHQGPIYCAAFSHDGSVVATGGYDKRILVWEPSQVKPYDFKRHTEEFVNRMREQQQHFGVEGITPRNRLFVPQQEFIELVSHAARVQSVAFSPDNKFLFSAGHDNTINIWDAHLAWTEGSKSLLKTLRGHGSPVRSCAVSKDGLVLSGSYDGTAKLWDVRRYEEVRVLLGKGPRHAEEVLDASFSGDDQGRLRIVTASQDRTAKIWRLDKSAGAAGLIEERAFVQDQEFAEGHQFLASTALYFAGGKKLLTCGVDYSARIWDVESGTELRKLYSTGGTGVMAVSPDDKWILTGGEFIDKEMEARHHSVRLWSTEKDTPPIVLEFHKGEVTTLAFSPDGTRFFTGDKNGRGRLWDAQTCTPIGTDMRDHAGAIVGAAFLPGGMGLLTASGDNHVARWDLSAETPVRVPGLTMAHPKGVKALAVTKDGRFAVTSCEDGVVRLWDVAQPAKPARTFFVTIKVQRGGKEVDAKGSVGSVAFSHDERRAIFVADDDRSVHTFAVDPLANDPAEMLLGLADSGAYVRSAIFAPGDKGVLTVGGNEALLWSATVLAKPGQRATETMRYSPHGVIASARFSPDRKRIVTASWDFTARIWNVETGRDELQLRGHRDQVNSALFSPDGRLVLTSSNDGTARVWDAATGRELRRYNVMPAKPDDKESGVRWASFSPGAGERIVTASSDREARVWDSKFPADLSDVKETAIVDKPLGTLFGHAAAVLHAVFSPDGKRIVTGSLDNTARIWTTVDVPDERDAAKVKKNAMSELLVLAGHTGGVNSATFSPDAKRVLTGSDDFTAKLWDADKGQEVLTLKEHRREVTSVEFSADGLHALTASRDGTAIMWTANDWRPNGKPPVEANGRE